MFSMYGVYVYFNHFNITNFFREYYTYACDTSLKLCIKPHFLFDQIQKHKKRCKTCDNKEWQKVRVSAKLAYKATTTFANLFWRVPVEERKDGENGDSNKPEP